MSVGCGSTVLAISVLVVFSSFPSEADGQRRGGRRAAAPRRQELAEIPPAPKAPIQTGFVILEGRFVPPPYLVDRENETISVNGRRFNVSEFESSYGPWQDAPIPAKTAEGLHRQVAWTLQNEGMFIGWSGVEWGVVESQRAYLLIATLLSDRRPAEKLESLISLDIPWVRQQQWADIIADNELEEYRRHLNTRVFAVVSVMNQVYAPQRRADSALWLASVLVTALGAFSLGNLVRFRPPRGMPWTRVDDSLETAKLIRYSVAFLVLLCVSDILCTGMSRHVIGVWDLSPYAAGVWTHGRFWPALKISVALAVVTLLLVLRRFHGTQVVAWWLGLACTFLSFRCVAYNSMLLV